MPRPYLRLVRLSDNGQQTEGVLEIYRDRSERSPVARFDTVEPPWKNNAPRQSCIPAGTYTAERRTSEKYGQHIHVRGTEPARSLILLHVGNTVRDTVGCILPGTGRADLDGDRDLDVTGSREAMKRLLELVPDAPGTDADLVIVSALARS